VIFYLSFFSFSIFQNYLEDDTSYYKKKLSKFNNQNIIVLTSKISFNSEALENLL